MAIRTTPTEVKQVLETEDSINMTPFIGPASRLVDWLSSQDTSGELSDDVLKDIETYLSAWLYSLRDQPFMSKNTGRSGATFQGEMGKYFELNYYGQAALMMDTTGRLRTYQEQKTRAKVLWLGTNYKDHDSNDPAYD